MIGTVPLLVLPIGLILISGTFLTTFGTILSLFNELAHNAASAEDGILLTLEPALRQVNAGLKNVFGSSVKFSFTHILLMAVVVMLVAVWGMQAEMTADFKQIVVMQKEAMLQEMEEKKKSKKD